MTSPILLVDDDEHILSLLQTHLTNLGYRTSCASSIHEAKQCLHQEEYHTVLLDLNLPDGDGMKFFEELQSLDASLPVIIITAHGSIEKAVDAMKMGAYDFCAKPIDFNRLTVSLKNAVERYSLHRRIALLEQARRSSLDELIGVSDAMQVLYQIIRSVAATSVPVFITGESGTGKDLVAKAIHRRSSRKDFPLIEVDCAAIANDLLESELFGYEPSAFTGAVEQRVGRFEKAHQSTIFLDGVTEIEPSMQGKLLRFLQDYSFYRVGGNEKIEVDVRILSATNENPTEAIGEERLRDDLYYRLNVVPIHIPPLRERKEDIALLAEHFLAQSSRMHQKSFVSIQSDVMDMFLEYPWPGNVRELKNVIEQCAVLYDEEELTLEMLPQNFVVKTTPPEFESEENLSVPSSPQPQYSDDIRPMEEVEKEAIVNALKITKGNVTQAAVSLHLGQATLYRKIRDYGIDLQVLKT